MKALWTSPARFLVGGVVFVAGVCGCAVLGYVACGWSFGDAIYMTILTVYTVGYEEVRPIDTMALRMVTLGLIVFGCTGMIFLTGALVQFITFNQLQQVLGHRRMQNQINGLQDHAIVCGYGRIGAMLSRDLHAGRTRFVVVERETERFEEARARGHLCIHADATDERTLLLAGIERARVVATVLPDDAANVFITLSARSLNPTLRILARGEAPSTERKLLQAGANAVVLPAHIGAERMAEMILYPGATMGERGDTSLRGMEMPLRRAGLGLELAIAEPGSAFAGCTVSEIERVAEGAFLIVGIERPRVVGVEQPQNDSRIEPGDGVLVMGRGGLARALEGFAAAVR